MARARGRALEAERQRKAAAQSDRKKAQGRRNSVILAVGAVVVLGAATAFVLLQPPPPGLAFTSLGNNHLEAIDSPHIPYNSSPPSSGPHVGLLAQWREHEEAVPPELYIHNLEDGGVALTYDCPDGCEALVAGLRDLVADYAGENVLMFPYEGITDPEGTSHAGAAVAWGRVFYFDDFFESESDIRTFIDLYEGIDNHVR